MDLTPVTFTSSHNRPDRQYRIIDCGSEYRLASCEYMRDGAWRVSRNCNTRHIAHAIANGRAHASLTQAGKSSVMKNAALARGK